MKRRKPIFVILCLAVLAACAAMFAACFGQEDENKDKDKDTTEYYTVTVAPYDGEGGTIAVSGPASEKGYVKDEQVTVTVTAATDYIVSEVKVNGTAVELTEGKYTFKVTGNTTVSATFEYVGWSKITWHEDTLGDLTFDEEYNMTLTPPGGEPQALILPEGVDLSEGFPAGEIDVIVTGTGTGTGVTAYKVSFGTFLVFKQGYTEYVFDSDPSTDFSGYAGTWKRYGGSEELVATAAGLTYEGKTYTEYYTGLDGSHYVKYQMTALTKPQRYLIGYRDSAHSVLYFNMNNNVYHFTKDGTLPSAAIPADFYGTWRNETYYDLVISADSATVNGSGQVSAFAVAGEGEDAVVHLYYNGLYWTMYAQKNAETGEREIVMDNGTTKNVFSTVKPEPLPTEYRAEWTRLGGSDTVSVDPENGKFTYNGKVYETIRDSHDLGFHFTTDAGKDALIAVSSDGYVLWIVTDADAGYFTKQGASLPDLTVALSGTWRSGGKTLTAQGGHLSVTDGGGAKSVQILTWAPESGEEAGYIGTALYDDQWWDVKYVASSSTVTFTSNSGTLTFTAAG